MKPGQSTWLRHVMPLPRVGRNHEAYVVLRAARSPRLAQPCAAAGAGDAAERFRGLFREEAQRRLERYGSNRLQPPRERGRSSRFLLQFHNVLIHALLAAGLMTVLLGDWVDSGGAAGVVVINAIIGFIQEGKAKKALATAPDVLVPGHATARRREDAGARIGTDTAGHCIPEIRHLLIGGCSKPGICASRKRR